MSKKNDLLPELSESSEISQPYDTWFRRSMQEKKVAALQATRGTVVPDGFVDADASEWHFYSEGIRRCAFRLCLPLHNRR